ncbi:hypothetical protein BH09GEM1_BH09GEM1_45050 [soil metagenome]
MRIAQWLLSECSGECRVVRVHVGVEGGNRVIVDDDCGVQDATGNGRSSVTLRLLLVAPMAVLIRARSLPSCPFNTNSASLAGSLVQMQPWLNSRRLRANRDCAGEPERRSWILATLLASHSRDSVAGATTAGGQADEDPMHG